MPLPLTPEHLGQARARVRRLCAQQQVSDELCSDLQLVLSELVGNAHRHAGPPVGYDVRPDGSDVLVVVEDANPDPPPADLPTARDTAESGRGLHLVAALSRAWGWRPTPNGKEVWARV